jgi:hypothetical protein
MAGLLLPLTYPRFATYCGVILGHCQAQSSITQSPLHTQEHAACHNCLKKLTFSVCRFPLRPMSWDLVQEPFRAGYVQLLLLVLFFSPFFFVVLFYCPFFL